MRTSLRWMAVMITAVVLSACVLRPRFKDLMEKGDPRGDQVAIAVVDAVTGDGIAGAAVSFGDGKDRFSGKTDERGVVMFPRSKTNETQDPIVVVDLPAGARANGYVIVAPFAQAAPRPPPEPPAAAPAGGEAPPAPAPAAAAPDAGAGTP